MKARLLLGVLGASILLMALPQHVEAGCRWTWDCSGGYPCQQVQVCDNTLDLPAIRPPGVSPIPSPSVQPIPEPTVPPIGTRQCQPQYLCNSEGNCRWETVCW